MQLIQDINGLPEKYRGGALTIGNFDGVHCGHAQILTRLVQQAKRLGGPAVVFTFDPHPGTVLRADAAPQPLLTLDQKAARIGELGVDVLLAYPTDRELLQRDASEFFDSIVRKMLSARAIVEGPNFRFGRDRCGTVEILARMCEQHNIKLEIVEPITLGSDAEIVSSSRVRSCLAAGDVQQAGKLLGRPYQISGRVTRGAGRGASLGFPTANLTDIQTMLPAQGVYAATVNIDSEASTQKYPAAVNIGPNPTFGEDSFKVECHIIDVDLTLYDQLIAVDFVRRLRDIHSFAAVEQLVSQLNKDVLQTKQAVAES